MRIRHLLIVSTVAAIVAMPSVASADSFADACRRFTAARVVFIGQVTGPPVRRHLSSQEQIDRFQRRWSGAEPDMAKRNVWPVPRDFVLTPMRVETAFRNIETADVYVRVQLPAELHVGQSYLIYGHHIIDPAIPDILFATDVIPQANVGAEEARFLDLARTHKFSASIYGSLMLHDSATPVPLADVPIRFIVGDDRFEAITNAAGRFIVTGIPAGNISVDPVLPPDLILSTLIVPWMVSLPDGGCSAVDLRVQKNRRIRGTILRPDGSPVTGARVDLVPLEEGPSQLPMQSTNTNDNGEFEFRGLVARTYLIGMNLRSLPTAGAPYTARYYPTSLDVGDATPHHDIEWVLDAPLATGEIEVIVNSGRDDLSDVVVACVLALAADGKSQQGATIPPARRGLKTLIIAVVEGVRYRIVARAGGGDRNMDSRPVELVGTAGRQSITLRTDSPAPLDMSICPAAF